MSGHYTLEGKEPIIESDVIKWAKWFESANRGVAFTQVTNNVDVSTVFLGLAHGHKADGSPILFETMVFGGELDQEMRRYSTWEQAEQGHEAVVKLVKLVEGIDG